MAKIILLVDAGYDTHIVQFARRDINKMRRWADKPNADIRPEDCDFDAVSKSKKTADSRYKAINLRNYNTQLNSAFSEEPCDGIPFLLLFNG